MKRDPDCGSDTQVSVVGACQPPAEHRLLPARAEPASHLNAAAYPRPGLAPVSWREHYFPDVSDSQWADWHWQFRNRIRTLEQLDRLFSFGADERRMLREVLKEFRLGITPYYLSLIDPDDPDDPLRLQAVPSAEEFLLGDEGELDPLPRINSRRCPASCIATPIAAC